MTAQSGTEPFQSLVALNRALLTQHLLRGIAHDLRNHLQVLTLGVTMDGGSPSASLAPRLEQAVQSMSATLDLLARLGRMEPDPIDWSDLKSVIEQTASLADLQRNLPARQVEIGAIDPAIRVAMPPTVLLQVLLNLVANAKAAEAPPRAKVSIQADGNAPDTVAVVVEDGGPGLRPGSGALWATEGDRQLHAGIGLPVVEHLASRYGGHLRHPGGLPHRVVLTLPTIGPG